MDLPIYLIQITDDLTDDNGLKFVSLVDAPAIEENFLAFSKTEVLKYAIDEERRIVTGPAIIVDKPIIRKIDGQMCYTVFDRENTLKAMKKWARMGLHNSVNLQHSEETQSVFLLESYMINRERGINPPKEWPELTDGSVMMSYMVDDEKIWESVKAGEFNGFSVEGKFGLKESDQTEASLINELAESIENFCTEFLT